jgi:hypothetical protein
MTGGDGGDGSTRVWKSEAVEAALGEGGRAGRRRRSGGGGGSIGWQVGWRLVLWAVALALGWYLGVRFFG